MQATMTFILGDIARLHGLARLPCRKKEPHKSRGAAEAHLRALRKRFGDTGTLAPYVCTYCGHWHIGRSKRQDTIQVKRVRHE
jgi:hypothetical protein